MIALIDSDITAFRCAAAAENDNLENALMSLDKMMRTILDNTEAESYMSFISGTDNFRKVINPEYKAHRAATPKPRHLKECRDFLIREWAAVECHGAEADDYLGLNQKAEETVICSIDKDLLQIPGFHYNFVKQEYQEVTTLEGIKHFYKQMLIGDVADNIRGVDGIGKVKAGKLIDPLETEDEMMQVVCKLYNDPDRFQTNADCLWIWRTKDQMYTDRAL